MIEETVDTGAENRTDAEFALVLLYNREQRYNDALRVLDSLHRRYPRNRLVMLEAGATATRGNRPADAEKLLTDGMAMLAADKRDRIPGEDALWHYKRGAARVMLGRRDDALADLQAALDAGRRRRLGAGTDAPRDGPARAQAGGSPGAQRGRPPRPPRSASGATTRSAWTRRRESGSGVSMAGKVKTWVWVVIGIVVVRHPRRDRAWPASGLWFVKSHVDIRTHHGRRRHRRFPGHPPALRGSEAAHRARRARPVPARQHRIGRPAPQRPQTPQRHGVRSPRREGRPDGAAVLDAAAEDGRHPLRRRAAATFDMAQLHLTVEDLERYGPTLILDQKDTDGSRVLVWSQ